MEAAERPVYSEWPTLYRYAEHFRQARASDLHVIGGYAAYARIDGDLTEPFEAPSVKEVRSFLASYCTEYQMKRLEHEWSTDAAASDPAFGRLRIHAADTSRGIGLVLRFLDDSPMKWASLDLPQTIANFTGRPSGLILISGVTGSGKTSLNSSLIDYMLEQSKPRIWTLEDPIEYVFDNPLVSQREIGRNCKSFSAGLVDAMREDPDAIVVGEIRDPSTAEAALTAAESGHIVFGTIHTSETASVFDRFLGIFPEGSRDLYRVQLASSLIGCVGMKLVKRHPDMMKRNPELSGRRGACEILINTDSLRAAIMKSKTTKDIRDIVTNSVSSGMISLEAHLTSLVSRNEITKLEAESAAEHAEDLPWVNKK